LKVPILRSFGSTPETFQYANDYLNIILIGVLFQVVGFLLNNVIRSDYYSQKILNKFLVVIFRMKLTGVKRFAVVFHNLVATGF
jgi:Na+-driven multidrug efflux pump